jgi:oligopeptide transport system substrate-binding protein
MADPVLSKQIIRYNTLTTFALQFNVHMAPFDNATLRQALSCGIDRQAYINQVRNGIGKVALSWIPPGMPGYNPNIGTDYTFNATKAQQLLSQAGYPNAKGLPAISFQYANSGLNPQLAQFLQQQLQTNMNINLTLQPMEPKSFSGLVNANQASWSWTGWSADYPDPDDWLPSCFLTGAGNNHTTYSNPTFDALAAKALVNLDNTSRLQQWDQAQTIIMNDAPIVTFFYQERFNCLKPWVQGFTTTGMDSQVAGDRYYELITIASSNSQTTGVITTPATSTAATTTPASTT